MHTTQGEFNALRDELMRSYPDRAALFFSYDEPLSHLIYAASDMFLVPSMFEPCGLTQVRGGGATGTRGGGTHAASGAVTQPSVVCLLLVTH